MPRKNTAAVELGRRGGKARARKLTAEQRSEAARKAVEARWAKLRALTNEITQRSKALERTSQKRLRASRRKARAKQ